MVLVMQKIGTLCIEYRPSETMSRIVIDDGTFSEDDCDLFIICAQFLPNFVELLPIYDLDPRCYSLLKIKCYSFFDAMDFCQHLSLKEFELKFKPSRITNKLKCPREELMILQVYSAGSCEEEWALQVDVPDAQYFIFSDRYHERATSITNFKLIYDCSETQIGKLPKDGLGKG